MDNYEIKTINITVRCPLDEYGLTKYKIQMGGIVHEDGSGVFVNNGCDMRRGSIVCDNCIRALNLMFTNGYRPDHYEIVTPDFSIFQSHNEEPKA